MTFIRARAGTTRRAEKNGECGIIMKENIILNKSFDFSVRIINLYRYLMNNSKEYVLSKQILRSGTSIGANVNEAIEAQSKKDFISKMGIALKETSETIYWLRLLHATKYTTKIQFYSICADAYEIKRIISSIILSSKEKKAENDGK